MINTKIFKISKVNDIIKYFNKLELLDKNALNLIESLK